MAEKVEETRNLSEAGAMHLVTLRLKYQSRFDNTSDKADAIWAHIHDEFMKLVENGDLVQTDGRSAQALEKRWNTELGEFRLWASTANRAVELSGVPADEVEDKVRVHWRPTTSLFRKSNYAARPMSIPPFQINSESAPMGGMGNSLSSHVRGDVRAHDVCASEEWDDADENAFGDAFSPGPASSVTSGTSAKAGSSMAGSSRDGRLSPTPLHYGGATGKSGKKKEREMNDFVAMYRSDQEANRKLAEDIQSRHEKECERQRVHEKQMAEDHCKQQ